MTPSTDPLGTALPLQSRHICSSAFPHLLKPLTVSTWWCQGVGHSAWGLHSPLARSEEHELGWAGNRVLMEGTGWLFLQSSDQEMGTMHWMHGEGSRDQGQMWPGSRVQCHAQRTASGCCVQEDREGGKDKAGCHD